MSERELLLAFLAWNETQPGCDDLAMPGAVDVDAFLRQHAISAAAALSPDTPIEVSNDGANWMIDDGTAGWRFRRPRTAASVCPRCGVTILGPACGTRPSHGVLMDLKTTPAACVKVMEFDGRYHKLENHVPALVPNRGITRLIDLDFLPEESVIDWSTEEPSDVDGPPGHFRITVEFTPRDK